MIVPFIYTDILHHKIVCAGQYCAGMSVEYLDNSFFSQPQIERKAKIAHSSHQQPAGIKCAGENIIK